VALHQAIEALPRETVTLAATHQHSPPRPADFASEAGQPISIFGDCEVVEVPEFAEMILK
jgi:hypothetical protein